jgi:rod shape-determining protein MreC
MVLDHRGTYLEDIRRQLTAAVYPVQQAVDAPSGAFRWLKENVATRERLQAENAELRRTTLVNTATLQKYAALQAENTRLRGLLESQARVPDKVVIGEVLSVDMDPLHHRVVVNKGNRSGARDGQALLDAFGVVGQITRTAPESAEALLITDPDHAVPVEVVRNGLRTIAVGTGKTDSLSLPFLTRNQDIKPGDLLVTSGLGGVFPAGYPVGSVTAVDDSQGDAFRAISARPAASLDRLHEVLLVLPGTAPTISDADLSPPPGLAEPPVRSRPTRPAAATAPAAPTAPAASSSTQPAGRASPSADPGSAPVVPPAAAPAPAGEATPGAAGQDGTASGAGAGSGPAPTAGDASAAPAAPVTAAPGTPSPAIPSPAAMSPTDPATPVAEPPAAPAEPAQ